MKPVRGEKPPFSSISRSQIWRGVRSQEGKSRGLGFRIGGLFSIEDEVYELAAMRGNEMTVCVRIQRCSGIVFCCRCCALRGSRSHRSRLHARPVQTDTQACTLGENGRKSSVSLRESSRPPVCIAAFCEVPLPEGYFCSTFAHISLTLRKQFSDRLERFPIHFRSVFFAYENIIRFRLVSRRSGLSGRRRPGVRDYSVDA